MAQIKFTKTELRSQQHRLLQLQKYLPTLQLKKALLRLEVQQVEAELDLVHIEFKSQEERVQRYSNLLTDPDAHYLFESTAIAKVEKRFENIAGVEVPLFERVLFAPKNYSLFDTPLWMESAISGVEEFLTIRERIKVLREKKLLLSKELREVSIRVNLFEKILIPRTTENISRIRIFLGDQMLAAVAQAKVSKRKIEERRAASR